MLDTKSISMKKAFKARLRQILFQVQLFEQEKQNNAAAVEATNHNSATAETVLNVLNRQEDSIIMATVGQKITGQGTVIGLEVAW